MQALSAAERTALLKILQASARSTQNLKSRQKAALDAYLYVLSQPPLEPIEVLAAARALIRTWDEVKDAQPRKPSEVRRRIIDAILLDPVVIDGAGTEQMTPMALRDVLDSYRLR